MEGEKKVRTEIDGWLRQLFLLSRECLVSTHQPQITKHGKRDDDKSVFV